MKTFRGSVSRGTFVAATASAFSAVTVLPVRAATITWKYGNPFTIEYPVNVRMIQAFKKIYKDTNEQLDIRPYLNAVLGTPGATIEQLRLGAAEIFCDSGGSNDGLVPVAGIENIAYAFATKKQAFAAMDGDLGKIIRDLFPAKGLVVLENMFDNGFRNFTTNSRPIRTADDLQGLKLRVSPGKLRIDTFVSLGASATVVSTNEMYTAMQTHLVDGQETPLLFIENLRFYEVQKYCSLSRHIWSGYWTYISKKRWDELPHNYQEIVRKHINEAAITQRRDSDIQDRSVGDKLKRQGLVFNEVQTDTLRAKLRSAGYYNRWRTEYGDVAWNALEKYAGPVGR